MNLGQITLVVFASLIEAGGIVGFQVSRSKPSLIAGLVSGGLLFIAFAITFLSMAVGLWMGVGVSLLLCLVFCLRLAKTRKFMPAGMLLVLSIVASGLLIASVLGEPQ